MAEAALLRVSSRGRGLQVVKSQLRLVAIQVRLLDQPQLGTGAVVGGGCRLERDGPIDLRNCLLATVEHAEGLGPQDMGKSMVLEHRDRRGEVGLGLGNVDFLAGEACPGRCTCRGEGERPGPRPRRPGSRPRPPRPIRGPRSCPGRPS